MICPHGDPTCPCPDGDACHYEGEDAMTCPNPPAFVGEVVLLEHPSAAATFRVTLTLHCHVEGCTWEKTGCGLARLGVPPREEPPPVGDVRWACGAQRAGDRLMAQLDG